MSTFLSSVVPLLSLVAVPDPAPEPPPGFDQAVDRLLGWGRWAVIAAGVAGMLAVALMMILGRRNRSAAAMEALVGLPWIAGGLALASSVAVVVGVFAL